MTSIEIEFWYWWVVAVGLLVLELLVPGFFFLWLAVSALVVGVLLGLMPFMAFEGQLFVFSLLSVVTVLGWRHYSGRHKQAITDHPFLNKRGSQYIGRTFNVVTAIENGRGKIKVGDSLWMVTGKDCPAGSKVKVMAVKGTVLEVEIYQ